jgi:hypothetical protein
MGSQRGDVKDKSKLTTAQLAVVSEVSQSVRRLSVKSQGLRFKLGFFDLDSWSVVRTIPSMPRLDRHNGPALYIRG